MPTPADNEALSPERVAMLSRVVISDAAWGHEAGAVTLQCAETTLALIAEREAVRAELLDLREYITQRTPAMGPYDDLLSRVRRLLGESDG